MYCVPVCPSITVEWGFFEQKQTKETNSIAQSCLDLNKTLIFKCTFASDSSVCALNQLKEEIHNETEYNATIDSCRKTSIHDIGTETVENTNETHLRIMLADSTDCLQIFSKISSVCRVCSSMER